MKKILILTFTCFLFCGCPKNKETVNVKAEKIEKKNEIIVPIKKKDKCKCTSPSVEFENKCCD
jgi:hypothetical protein